MTYTFEGTSVEYIYTKAPNRGIAKITIDGKPVAEIDQYSPTIQWRQSWRRDVGTSKLQHRVEITLIGRHKSIFAHAFVDLDAIHSR